MMNIHDSYSIYVLLIANALLLVAATLAILRLHRVLRSSVEIWDRRTGNAARAHDKQGKINETMQRRIASLQHSVTRLAPAAPNPQSAPAEKLHYDRAVRMVKAGAGLQDLERTCGLSAGEAQLFMRVHATGAS